VIDNSLVTNFRPETTCTTTPITPPTGHNGPDVNAIAPGYFETNNTAALPSDDARAQQILARIPAGRWCRPSDLAGAAVFLASAASDYVHGILLPVDGRGLAR